MARPRPVILDDTYSPSPNTSQLQPRLIRPLADAAGMKARRTLRSLGEGGLERLRRISQIYLGALLRGASFVVGDGLDATGSNISASKHRHSRDNFLPPLAVENVLDVGVRRSRL